MRGQYEELNCPFCDKGRIQCWFIPSSFSMKKIHVGSNTSLSPRKSSEIWLIKTGCSVCGKSQEEVEKELKKRNII